MSRRRSAWAPSWNSTHLFFGAHLAALVFLRRGLVGVDPRQGLHLRPRRLLRAEQVKADRVKADQVRAEQVRAGEARVWWTEEGSVAPTHRREVLGSLLLGRRAVAPRDLRRHEQGLRGAVRVHVHVGRQGHGAAGVDHLHRPVVVGGAFGAGAGAGGVLAVEPQGARAQVEQGVAAGVHLEQQVDIERGEGGGGAVAPATRLALLTTTSQEEHKTQGHTKHEDVQRGVKNKSRERAQVRDCCCC